MNFDRTSGQQFDVNTAILKSLSGLKVDLSIASSVKLDDCKTLVYSSSGFSHLQNDRRNGFIVHSVWCPRHRGFRLFPLFHFTQRSMIRRITQACF